MPAFLLIGIPLIVGVLLFGILTLPDDENLPGTSSKKKSKKK